MQVYGTMWDSASGAQPPLAALAAYYINGRYARRPVTYGPGRVWIDVTGADPAGALWLDVETGDATPGQVGGWLDARRNSGAGTGGIYCNVSTLAAVESAAAGRPHLLWIATLDGTTSPALPPRVTGQIVAVQAYPASMLGFNADESVVVDRAWWQERAAP
jgi:hypothetical protein